MRLWLWPPCLADPIPIAVSAGCPREAAATYFHHLLPERGDVRLPRSLCLTTSRRLDGLLDTIDRGTRAVLRRASERCLIFRGAAVTSPRGSTLVFGRAGTGKTTRVASLVRQGATYVGDDFLFFSPRFERVSALPVAVCERRLGAVRLWVPPHVRADVPVADVGVVDVLRPQRAARQHAARPRVPVLELLALNLRHAAAPVPFQLVCDHLAPLARWARYGAWPHVDGDRLAAE